MYRKRTVFIFYTIIPINFKKNVLKVLKEVTGSKLLVVNWI
ncbi:hypothetical protein EfmE1679_2433 [Enterococcus faecium E1679]|nr:hypothetical protein EfmE1679_2433 [Enterococcus faecium E1679]